MARQHGYAVYAVINGQPEILMHTVRATESAAETQLVALMKNAQRAPAHWMKKATSARVVKVLVISTEEAPGVRVPSVEVAS